MKHHFKLFSPTWAALAASALIAACGGGGSAGSPTGSEDTTPPTVAITAAANSDKKIVFTFDFNEPVTGFTVEDVTIDVGTKGEFNMAINNRSATLIVTPPADSQGTIQATVAAGAFKDFAENASVVAANVTQAFGTAAPSAYLSFDETPGNFSSMGAYGGALPDVVTGPSGGSGKALKVAKPAGAGSQVWGGTFFTVPRVPFTTTQKAITARVYSTVPNAVVMLKVEKPNGSSNPCTECTEVAGTTVTQANTWTTVTWDFSAAVLTRDHTLLAITPDANRTPDGATYYIDDIRIVDTPPSVTITDDTNGSATAPVTFTFSFSKAVNGFTANNVTVTNGTKGAFAMASDGLSATLVVTPPSSGSGSMGVSVAAGTFTDSGGNNNIAGASSSQAYGAAFAALDIVRAQTGTENSYVVAPGTPPDTSLPGNNETGGYAWGVEQWWSGVGADSVFKGVGIASSDTGGFGVYVKGAGTTTWNIVGANSIEVGLGTNPTCVGTCAATIVLKATDSCIATINVPFTILTETVNTGNAATTVNGAIPTYTRDLTATHWTVDGCTTNTMEAFKQLPLKEVHAQMLRANMQTTTLANNSPKFANGINLGAIKIR